MQKEDSALVSRSTLFEPELAHYFNQAREGKNTIKEKNSINAAPKSAGKPSYRGYIEAPLLILCAEVLCNFNRQNGRSSSGEHAAAFEAFSDFPASS